MKTRLYRITRMVLFCCLAAALPAFAQDNHPQQNDHPERQKQTQNNEHRAQPAQSHEGARQQANPRQEQHNASHPQEHRQSPQTQDARPNRDNNHAQQQSNRDNYHSQQQPNRGNYHQQQSNRGARPSPERDRQDRSNHGRPAQWGRPPSHRGSYRFRSNDRSRLHSYYMDQMRAINRANRPVFRVGGYFPYDDIGYLSPLPPDLYGALPPPPYGYQMGYYDGYVVVYDPMTYFIASVIDLLQ